MQYRVSLRRFVDKWMAAGDHQRPLRIQPRSFRTVIARVHHHPSRKLTLYIEIPDLHVAKAIVRVDGEVVGHRVSGGRETICEFQRARAYGGVTTRGSRRWV